ncbi:TPA: hypothetical protein ACPI87_001653 [Haemophilus influenzae]|uniref:Uncharacterized protein n=1 Tax=Haemophilus influenzae TaxID=727 RepID=A0A2S9RPK2_HAEIF|nr:hypothetical protein [Haemophilus influenzae]AWP53451.1 hypothetical protein DLJ98_00825 [Haemophilus influenzae]MCK8853296.1 hypothetical protein [Haemophilus influenzae]MCK8910849.1 hypothetical protein [Haemophilus influenzae]PRI36496.1 hypothetical protein BVZ56_01045 [Haemophilus influenzae]PRI47612.1 hypothetical protein BVZ70_01836 [Haemophilus influenzae]
MNKLSLAFVVLATVGLSACSSFQKDENAYKGQIVFSQMEGENLKLTIRKNDCSGNQQKGEEVIIVHKYDSTLAVGACVTVSNNSQVKNISSFSPRNPF